MTRLAKWWVGAFTLALAVFGFGQLQAWPFTSWYMFSHVEPSTISIARAVAVYPNGRQRILDDADLPYGLLSHRLLQNVEANRARVCASLMKAAPGASSVTVERVSWHPLARKGDQPADATAQVITSCV